MRSFLSFALFAGCTAIATALVFTALGACAGANGDPAPQPAEGGAESATTVPCVVVASDGGAG